MALKPVINGVIFQAGWILSVLYGDRAALAVTVAAALIYSVFYLRNRYELALITSIAACGVLGDIALGLSDVLRFPSALPLPPYWMVTLWLLFASTIPWALRWLVQQRVWFIILCAIGGPLSYWIGVSRSVVQFGPPLFTSLLVLAGLWTGYGILINALYRRWQHQF